MASIENGYFTGGYWLLAILSQLWLKTPQNQACCKPPACGPLGKSCLGRSLDPVSSFLAIKNRNVLQTWVHFEWNPGGFALPGLLEGNFQCVFEHKRRLNGWGYPKWLVWNINFAGNSVLTTLKGCDPAYCPFYQMHGSTRPATRDTPILGPSGSIHWWVAQKKTEFHGWNHPLSRAHRSTHEGIMYGIYANMTGVYWW